MEASQAGLAGPAQGDGDGGEAGQGPDLGALTQQLSSLSEGQEQMRQFLASNPWAAQEQTQDEGDGYADDGEIDLSFLEDPNVDPEAASQHLSQLIEQQTQQRVQEALRQQVNPIAEQLTEMRREQEADRLVSEFPELGEQETAELVVGNARSLVEAHGWPADLAGDPRFWRLTYMAGRAADAANEEGSESSDAAHLEGAGGAGPAAGQVDLGQMIVNASQGGRSVLPF